MDNGYLIEKYEKLQNKLNKLLSSYETLHPLHLFFGNIYLPDRIDELQKELKEIRNML